MTKVTIFGQKESKKEEKKAIEFVWFLDSTGNKGMAGKKPDDWDNVCLLGKDDENKYDLMIAWDDGYTDKYIYLGHWNDGVV